MYFSAPLKITSYAKIDPTSKWEMIAKFRLQILEENLQRFTKCNYFFKIEEKMTELRCLKVGGKLKFEDSCFTSDQILKFGNTSVEEGWFVGPQNHAENTCEACRKHAKNMR